MNLFVYFRSAIFIVLGILFFVPLSTHAQSDALKVNVMPASPGPNETVTIVVEDFTRDLNGVDIRWSVDGKVVTSGTGIKRFQTKTGAIGSTSKITINMGGVVQTVTLRPTVTDLIWQADSFTPPFYKGKALHSTQDPITVVAEPFISNSAGVRLDPNKLTYRWSLDGKVNGGASGYGKRAFKITPSVLPKPLTVSVEVASTDEVYKSSASVSIPNTDPEIVFYENHPLYGVRMNTALNGQSFNLTSNEANVVAVPFFFSNDQKELNLLSYTWKLNNNVVNQDGEEIIVRKPQAEGSGKSSISLAVKNLERFMQTATAEMFAAYNNESTNTQTTF
ncbi:MAG TPA: hypothetical protein VK145_02005 [Candidatus Nanoarchaeia archaeon]|nr:hypothetical protein [Candidatus Nanoarchaeia archaeon]